jgi:GNAT superfamily N-acetyltransferase
MRLAPQEWPAFAHLTYPRYARLLRADLPDSSIVAVGAMRDGSPVGLGLAQVRSFDEPAEVLSLFVAPPSRGRGVGTDLLREIDGLLRESGCPGAEVVYATPRPEQAALERVLGHCGWPPATGRMLLGQGTRHLLDAPVLRRASAAAELDVRLWGELPVAARDAADRRPRIPDPLRPRQYERGMHAETSLGLVADGDVVGWIITHPVPPRSLRYTTLYVGERWRRRGQGLWLAAEAGRRQEAVFGGDTTALFGVWLDNVRMTRFVRRSLAPFLFSLKETRGAMKRYAPAAAGA